MHEVGRLLALERRHELLVVDPERVRRVVLDPGELFAADPDVLLHRALPVRLGQRVPRPHLYERIDDEVGEAVRRDLPRLARARVLRRLRRREVRVGRLEPAREGRAVERRTELLERLVTVRDLPEEEVGVGPDAGGAVRAQVLEALREGVHDLGELVLVRLALLHGEPPPRRIDAVEAVSDVLALHAAKCYPGSSASPGSSGSGVSPSRLSQPSTLSRKPWDASLASR